MPDPTVDCRRRLRFSSGQPSVHAASHRQGGSVLSLSATPSAPDSSLRWQGSHYPSGSGVRYIKARLLQLTPSRSATVHVGVSSTRPERRSTFGVRSGRKRSRHRQFDTAALGASHWRI